jgi:hypothetical protein
MRYLITWTAEYATNRERQHLVETEEARDALLTELRADPRTIMRTIEIWRPWIPPAKRQRARVLRKARETINA